jgi:sporulation-control protein
LLKYVKELLTVGLPKVDLIINTTEATSGDIISGNFHLKGGRKKQKLKRLECVLMKEHQDGSEETVETITTILMSRIIHEKEDLIVPFTFQISTNMEPSTPEFSYKFHTNLFFADNKVSEDHDELVII